MPESLVFTRARILLLASLLLVALLDPFDPYSPFKFLIFINLVYQAHSQKLQLMVLLYKIMDLFNKILDLFSKIVDFLTISWFSQTK